MSYFSPSHLALAASEHCPRVMTLVTRMWARSADVTNPHWLFTALRRRHDVEALRDVQLQTGEWVVIDPWADIVSGDIARQGCFEPETVVLFTKFLAPGMTVIDVGAHVGQYALMSSTAVGANGQVHAFEPEPRNYERLVRNIRRNNRTNISHINAAVSDKPGRADFNLAGNGFAACHSLGQTRFATGRTIAVDVMTLDGYVEACDIQRVDLLKADVEGAELLMLRGAANTLRRFKPFLIVECSVHSKGFGYEPADLVHFVRSAGYEVFIIEPHGLVPCRDQWPDAEFFNIAAIASDRVEQTLARLGQTPAVGHRQSVA